MSIIFGQLADIYYLVSVQCDSVVMTVQSDVNMKYISYLCFFRCDDIVFKLFCIFVSTGNTITVYIKIRIIFRMCIYMFNLFLFSRDYVPNHKIFDTFVYYEL